MGRIFNITLIAAPNPNSRLCRHAVAPVAALDIGGEIFEASDSALTVDGGGDQAEGRCLHGLDIPAARVVLKQRRTQNRKRASVRWRRVRRTMFVNAMLV